MAVSWTAAPVRLPGAVQYTLDAGDGPTGRWHVSVAMPPPGLQTAAGPGVRSEVIPDEQHATVWPAAVTRGLIHLYRTD